MIPRSQVAALMMVLLCAGCLILGGAGEAWAKDCKKGKKPCGGKCIPAKKVCKEDDAPAADAAPAGPTCKRGQKLCGDKCIPAKKACADGGTVTVNIDQKIASASETEVSAALQSPPGQAMLGLARALAKSGDLDVDDRGRQGFRQALRGARPPLPICSISHIQLVRDCDTTLKNKVTLPCYLAVDEMAEVCKAQGHPMPQFK